MAAGSPAPFSAWERMIALRYLRARRREGFISVIAGFSFLGIVLGVATLIIVMAVMNGFRAELLAKVLGFNGHVTAYSSIGLSIPDYDQRVKELLAVKGVTKAIPIVEGQVMATTARANTGVLVRGIREADLKSLPSVNNARLKGSLDGFGDSQGIAIGYRMAFKHGVGVGDKLTLISPDGPTTILGTTPLLRSYPIVAVFNVGMSEYDASVVYMPFAEAQDYFQIDNAASAIEIMVAKPDEVDSYIGPLNVAARGHLQFVTWKTTNQTFFNALQVESNVMFLILTLIILVAALNIVSGLIMLVKDKGHDIAILRTMGATSGAVLRIFFMTGAAIGTLGTLAGVGLGVVICQNIEEIRQFLSALTQRELFSPELYYLSRLPADMDLHQTVAIALMSLGLSFLATLYPSWRAARLDPVEALRYE